MATYTVPIDPNSFQTTGYQLPVNQIMQAVATRNAYWDANASSLKNAYGRIANMSLTLDQNKAQLQELMKGVDAGINKAVQSDLSIAPNLNDAMKVFDPINNNQNIMGDRAITEHYQRELRNAESFRTKDNGKEYSPTNVQDLMIGLDKFRKSNNPNTWREHYASRRTYTPYYDVQSEIRDLRKTFKPNVTSTTLPGVDPVTGLPNSMYLTTKTDKSSYENQWKAYLSANLSDKARTQLGINGRVSYYNNQESLLRDYSDYTQNKITNLAKERDVLNGSMAAIKDDALKQAYIEKIGQLDDDIKDLRTERQKMAAGDLSTLAGNEENIAGLVYADNYISNVARSLQVVDQEFSYKPDQVRMKVFGEEMENERLKFSVQSKERIAALDRQNRLDIAKAKKEQDEGKAPTWNPFVRSAGEDENKSFTQEMYDNKVETYKASMEGARTALQALLSKSTPGFDKMNQTERDAFLQTWVTQGSNKNHPLYLTYKKAFDIYNSQKTVRDQIVQEATDVAKQRYPQVFNNKERVIPTFEVAGEIEGGSKNINITNDDIKGAYLGTSTNLSKERDPFSGQYSWYKNIGGVKYEISGNDAIAIDIAISAMRERYGDTGDKVKEVIASNITQAFTVQKPDVDQYKNPQFIAARQGFQREFGLSDDALKQTTVWGRDQFGTYYNVPESITDENLGVTRKSLDRSIVARGGRIITQEGQKIYFLPYESGAAVLDNFYHNPELAPIQSYFDLKKAKSTNGYEVAPAGLSYEPNNTGEGFTFAMSVTNGKPLYYAIHKNSGKTVGTPAESLEEAALFLDSTFKSGKPEDVKNYLKAY